MRQEVSRKNQYHLIHNDYDYGVSAFSPPYWASPSNDDLEPMPSASDSYILNVSPTCSLIPQQHEILSTQQPVSECKQELLLLPTDETETVDNYLGFNDEEIPLNTNGEDNHLNHGDENNRLNSSDEDSDLTPSDEDNHLNRNDEENHLTPKEEYRQLKKQFKCLVYENESYQEELRNLQLKLLGLSRDKNFLLDRLQQYEKLSSSSEDSEKTVDESPVASKKRKSNPMVNHRCYLRRRRAVFGQRQL
uniref:HALZ domain-containing protein n=1 Tax=Syphacia muris TaxID=451379 RepID=A0A0N5AJY7_9BILA